MQPNRAAAIVLRYLYLIRRSPMRLIPIFLWSSIDVVLWGFISKHLNALASLSFDFVPILLGAVLFWDFCCRIMQGVTLIFFEDLWARNFMNFFASPLTLYEYVCGLVTASIATCFIGTAVMLLLACAIFGLSFNISAALLIQFLLVLFLFGIALGVVGVATVLRLGPAAEWLIWTIPALLAPLVGVFYPPTTLPLWLQFISAALPPTYVFEGLRAAESGGAVPGGFVLPALGLGVLYLILACWVFVRVYRHVLSTGLIARYSAESLS